MDKLGIIQGQNIVEQRLNFPGKEKIEIMDGVAIFETTVRFSSSRKD